MKWNELKSNPEFSELMTTWALQELFNGDQEIAAADKAVAWNVYIELRTRISTQELHFLDGDEKTALTSLYNLFQPSRELLAKQGPEAWCAASVVEAMLNLCIRPFTAKWHRKSEAGDLVRDDACRELRAELRDLQGRLRICERLLFSIARGHILAAAASTPGPVSSKRPRFGSKIRYETWLGLKAPPNGPQTYDKFMKLEQVEIDARRLATGSGSGSDDLVGLAISGGGIRSATFALGVVQGLVARGILKSVDLLSTVSGGGYLGSFLSTVLRDPNDDCGPTAVESPFKPDVANDSPPIRSLRNNSRYIWPASLAGWLKTVGQALYGVISNLVIFSTLVFAGVLLTASCMRPDLRSIHRAVLGHQFPVNDWSWLPVVLWLVCALLLYLLPISQRIGWSSPFARWPGAWECAVIGAGVLSLVVSAIYALPFVHFAYMYGVHRISDTLFDKTNGWSIDATWVLISHLAALVAARSQWLALVAQRAPRVGKSLFTLLWLAGPALLVFAYFELCRSFFTAPEAATVQIPYLGVNVTPSVLLFIGLFLGASLYAICVNVNLTSLHRFYRNRLAETYLLRRDKTEGVVRKDPLKLSDLRPPKSKAPYHLLNAALNLPGEPIAELRDRKCDFFVFSKHCCGSPVTGYQATTSWEAADPHLDLGTAMAISGAAAAPQMGMSSIAHSGFLLTMLNVRLGYWLHKPKKAKSKTAADPATTAAKGGQQPGQASEGESPGGTLPSLWPGPGPWYLFCEARGQMSLNQEYLNVSDGGHIENLGLMELLRRRCRFIIAIDGECDPGLDCPSLMRLQEFAKVDLGVTIQMDVSRIHRGNCQPEKDEQKESAKKEAGKSAGAAARAYSRGHFSVGTIIYPGEVIGWLLYIKLSITGNEPAYVLDYLRRFPQYPHQSTADQVFEEDQFEAYRCLGEHIADDLFSSEILAPVSTEAAAKKDLPVETWFRDLAYAFCRSR